MLPLVRVRLASDEMSMLPLAVWPLAEVLSAAENEGERRLLLRYEVDETDRGSAGRCDVAGERGDSGA